MGYIDWRNQWTFYDFRLSTISMNETVANRLLVNYFFMTLDHARTCKLWQPAVEICLLDFQPTRIEIVNVMKYSYFEIHRGISLNSVKCKNFAFFANLAMDS